MILGQLQNGPTENPAPDTKVVTDVGSSQILPLNMPLHLSLLDGESHGESQRELYKETLYKETQWGDRPPPSYQTTIRNVERHVFELVNQHRMRRGLPPLELDERISAQARQHSEAMAMGQVAFGHSGFSQRVDRIERDIRYRRIGENIAFNHGMMNPAQRALRGWLNSPTHRDHINGQYDLTGIGVARDRTGGFYITQIFLRRR